jgi:hypothetical protein
LSVIFDPEKDALGVNCIEVAVLRTFANNAGKFTVVQITRSPRAAPERPSCLPSLKLRATVWAPNQFRWYTAAIDLRRFGGQID